MGYATITRQFETKQFGKLFMWTLSLPVPCYQFYYTWRFHAFPKCHTTLRSIIFSFQSIPFLVKMTTISWIVYGIRILCWYYLLFLLRKRRWAWNHAMNCLWVADGWPYDCNVERDMTDPDQMRLQRGDTDSSPSNNNTGVGLTTPSSSSSTCACRLMPQRLSETLKTS